MAKGTSVEELYIGLGLDISQLQLDFEVAGKTVNQTISRLNSENKQVKLKADIDLAKLEGAGSAIDKLNVKEQSLTRQIEIQKQKLDILANAYKSAQNADKAQGLKEDSNLTRGAHTNYLRQVQEVEKLNAELRKVQAEQKKIGNGTKELNKIGTASQKAKAGIDGVAKSYGMLSTKATAFLGLATTGAGLFNITNSAMNAGESLYKLTTRLHLTTAEAGQLSRLFSIAGVGIEGIIPFFSQLDKKILSSKEGVDETSASLRHFGVRLKDAHGNLLPINKQLEQLAKGYEKAAQAGKLEEFQAQVLGRRGAELIPLLEDYNDNMEIASRIQTTGLLNPKEAHELSKEWRAMKAEAGQLQSAMGAALMPIAQEIMPDVKDGLADIVEYIKNNKDGIVSTIKTTGTALSDVLHVLQGIAQVLPDAEAKTRQGLIAGADNGLKRTKFTAENGGWVAKIPGIGTSLAEMFNTNDVNSKYIKSIEDAKKADEEAKKAREELAKSTGGLKNKTNSLTEADKASEQAANANAEAQDKAREAMEWRASAAGQLSEEIYKLTHNDTDNAIHEMYVRAEKAKAGGVSDELINQFVNAQSGKIAEQKFRNVTAPMAQAFKSDLQNQLDSIDLQAKDFMQKGASQEQAQAWAQARKNSIRADWDKQVAEQIDSVWKSEYQNQLDRIEHEKEAWIKKGLDEVKATQWAEAKKKEVQQNTIRQMFQQQREYLKAYRQAIAEGKGQEGAINAVRKKMREDAGIKDSDFTTPSEIAGFQDAWKQAQATLIPVLSDSVRASMVQVFRGSEAGYELPSGGQVDVTYPMETVVQSMGELSTGIDRATDAINAVNGQGTSNMPETQRQVIDLNVNVNGFTDGDLQNKFVEAGAEVIARALPDASVNLSY